MHKSVGSILLIFVLFSAALSFTAFAFTQSETEPGVYTVPIVSLETKAPLPPIKKAFAGAFGDAVQVEVGADGGCAATIENRHMSISVLGRVYEANVLSIEGAEVLSTKTETFSDPVDGIFSAPEEKETTVPAQFRLPLSLDDDGTQVLTITVDFMDKFMGKGGDKPMNVTLTLDTAALPQKGVAAAPTATAAAVTTAPTTTAAAPQPAQTSVAATSAATAVVTTAAASASQAQAQSPAVPAAATETAQAADVVAVETAAPSQTDTGDSGVNIAGAAVLGVLILGAVIAGIVIVKQG